MEAYNARLNELKKAAENIDEEIKKKEAKMPPEKSAPAHTLSKLIAHLEIGLKLLDLHYVSSDYEEINSSAYYLGILEIGTAREQAETLKKQV